MWLLPTAGKLYPPPWCVLIPPVLGRGLSLRDLIFTKLSVDFYLSKAYVSRSKKKEWHHGHSPQRFHGPNRRPACVGGNLDRGSGGKGGNVGNLMLAAVRAGSASNPAPSKRPKRVAEIAENAGIDGNEVFGVHTLAEIGQSLAETAETPGKKLCSRNCPHFAVSLSGCTPLQRLAVKTTGGNAGNTGNAQTSCQASAGSDSDHEAAIART